MNKDQIWQAVLGEIEIGLSKANFITWFKDTFISHLENGQVVIGVPSEFVRRWLENKFYKIIKSSLEKITGEKITEVKYQVELRRKEEVKPAPRHNQEASESKEEGENEKPAGEMPVINRFGLNSKYIFESFIVGRGNELAHAACRAVVKNPGKVYNPLFIYGGVGLGKTHLLQAIGNELSKTSTKILYTTSENFTNNYVQAVRSGKGKEFKNMYRNVDLLLVDDVQFMGGKDGTQEEFFHTFNELHQGNKQIVLTSDRPPKSIPAIEDRLISRFECGMVVDVGRPDVETKLAILEKKATEKNYIMDQEVLMYVANNIQNNIRELEGALNKVIAYHEFNNTAPNIKSVKDLLSDLTLETRTKSLSPRDVIDIVAKYYNISSKELMSGSRKKELVNPRQISIYLIREELSTSYPTIGQELGGRDHTTAMHAYNKVAREIESNEKLSQEINSIKQLFYSL
ncbi:MAG TPA: chromosomal replication initiator protein DnaA [bacterium]|nr:chromosomal replication initiator protein DnaA [bacterium]HPT29476.1 chromosomal replication initiator protein DnaA [bacterium]